MTKNPNPEIRIVLDTNDPLYRELSDVTGLHGGNLNGLLWRVAAASLIAHLKAFSIQP
jgi:hypothetical protein